MGVGRIDINEPRSADGEYLNTNEHYFRFMMKSSMLQCGRCSGVGAELENSKRYIAQFQLQVKAKNCSPAPSNLFIPPRQIPSSTG
jgi:hypothetical protein